MYMTFWQKKLQGTKNRPVVTREVGLQEEGLTSKEQQERMFQVTDCSESWLWWWLENSRHQNYTSKRMNLLYVNKRTTLNILVLKQDFPLSESPPWRWWQHSGLSGEWALLPRGLSPLPSQTSLSIYMPSCYLVNCTTVTPLQSVQLMLIRLGYSNNEPNTLTA